MVLSSLPQGKRNVKARATAKKEEPIRISREYGGMYFGGSPLQLSRAGKSLAALFHRAFGQQRTESTEVEWRKRVECVYCP